LFSVPRGELNLGENKAIKETQGEGPEVPECHKGMKNRADSARRRKIA